jgi:hypothetical protein
MLHPNADHRYTIDRVLAHPWLTETIQYDDTHDTKSLPRPQDELNSYFKQNEYLKKTPDQNSKRKREHKYEKKQKT